MKNRVSLFGSSAVQAISLSSILVTGVVIYWMLSVRSLVPNPKQLEIFYRFLMTDDYQVALVFPVLLLVALWRPIQQLAVRCAVAMGDHPLVTALLVTAGLALGSRFVYLGYPLSMDEYAPVFQSQIFAMGRAAGEFPPGIVDWLVLRDFQNVFFMVSHETGLISSSYWPGFALLLTPFSLAGVYWLCNPVIGGLTIVAVHRLAMRLFDDRRLAGFALLFLIASATFAINSISLYSMSAHVLFNTVFALLVMSERVRSLIAAGIVGSFALVLHNPVPHLLFCIPWFVWLLLRPNGIRNVAIVAAAYLPIAVSLGFGWNYYLRGLRDVPVVAQTAVASGAESGLLGSELKNLVTMIGRIFAWPSLTLFEGRVAGLSKLWLWSSPAIVSLALWGAWRMRSDGRIRALAFTLLTTFVGFLFFPADQGHGWGFRYLQSAWIAVPLLAVASIAALNRDEKVEYSDVAGYACGCAMLALILLLPVRLYQTGAFIREHLTQLPPQATSTQTALVFVNPQYGYYAKDLVHNEPSLRNRPLMLYTFGEEAEADLARQLDPKLILLERDVRGSSWGRKN